jgi:hypothetical protein
VRRLPVVLLILQAAATGVLDSAAAQEPAPGSDADRLRDLLSKQDFQGEVCLRDVNRDGTRDLLVVQRYGPPGSRTSADSIRAGDQGVVLAALAMATRDAVLRLSRDSLGLRVEYESPRVFRRAHGLSVAAAAGVAWARS